MIATNVLLVLHIWQVLSLRMIGDNEGFDKCFTGGVGANGRSPLPHILMDLHEESRKPHQQHRVAIYFQGHHKRHEVGFACGKETHQVFVVSA